MQKLSKFGMQSKIDVDRKPSIFISPIGLSRTVVEVARKDPKLVVLKFNHYINEQNIDGLSKLMTNDHTFIDSSDEVHEGKEEMIEGWGNFFNR